MGSYTQFTGYLSTLLSKDLRTCNFKSNDNFTYMLEHCTKTHGDNYLHEIMTRFPAFFKEHKDYLITLSHINDLYGDTKKETIDHFTRCSPSNLRYIFQSILIFTHMNECNLTEVDIIEIGGGYGGLCFYIYNMAELFNIKVKSYTIFDLLEPALFQKKYLNLYNIHVNHETLSNIKNVKPNSFLISNYAFSELSIELQNEYTEKVLNPYTSHGFLAWNWKIYYEFIKNKSITKEVEYPLTDIYNYYVKFRPL